MELPDSVQDALAAAKIPITATTLVVQVADSPQPSLSINAQTAYNPASVMKLVTTYAALQELGPGYQWHTEIRSRQQPTPSGVLHSDLVIRGSGDPKLDLAYFWQLLRQLRTHGVREIRGDLLLDRRHFDIAAIDTSAAQAFDDQPWRAYNAQPDALLVNFNSFKVQLEPVAKNQVSPSQVKVTLDPAIKDLVIDNQLQLDTFSACVNWRKTLRANIVAARQESGSMSGPHASHLQFSGTYSAHCGAKNWYLAPLPAPQYTALLFKELWQELGGLWSGGLRQDATATELDAPVLLATSVSPPLNEIIRDINKYSNNVMARQLFLTLAAQSQTQQPNRPASPADGITAVKNILLKNHIPAPELVLENGSGLSRHARISAQTMAQLLRQAWQSPFMPEFISSLPIIASDGTMSKRLLPLRHQGHFKTGTLEGVNSLAGYLRDRNGRWLIVIFIVNHPNAAASQAAQDALLNWLWNLPSSAE